MASRCEVVLAAASEQQAQQLAALAITEVRRIESKYSRYRADSVLSRINAQAGRASVAIDSETASLLDYAEALFVSSAGLFDITSGVLRRAWNFKQQHVPDDESLAPLLALVSWSQVQRSQQEIFLPQVGMEIDFGGFGKEYAADRAASVLLAQGVQHGYVNLGGDLRIFGPMPDGSAWQIGIADPRASNAGTTCANLPVQSGALATSGDYERYIEVDGVRHCHILLPHNGHSVRY
ncbi:MAG: FAD:protein FMN transferase, partial [Burkholderiales bacterium]|nr:FAD:protein FMN transferase [Burkholderiales bacterium]